MKLFYYSRDRRGNKLHTKNKIKLVVKGSKRRKKINQMQDQTTPTIWICNYASVLAHINYID
jgi:hypothetical protein